MALNFDDVKKLSDSDVKKLYGEKKLSADVYIEWLDWSKTEAVAKASNRKQRAFKIELSDKGVFCLTGLDVGFAICIPPVMAEAVFFGDSHDTVTKFIADNLAKAKELRTARKASDDYKAAQTKRREEMAANKKTAT